MEDKNFFSYTYSADENDEIKKIRDKYLPPEEDKLERIRKLDSKVTSKATAFSLFFGIVSTLVMGIGMCCVLVWKGTLFIPGVLVGLIGISGAGVTYPLYNHILKKERQKAAPEIIRLTDELMI